MYGSSVVVYWSVVWAAQKNKSTSKLTPLTTQKNEQQGKLTTSLLNGERIKGIK